MQCLRGLCHQKRCSCYRGCKNQHDASGNRCWGTCL